MENIDKDVAAMLNNLKKYDMLKESVAPVLERKKPKEEEKEEEIKEEDESKNPWRDLSKKDKESTHTGGTVTKTEKGMKHSAGDKKDKKDEVKEGADTDVLAWMKRFANLGNMKGYGR